MDAKRFHASDDNGSEETAVSQPRIKKVPNYLSQVIADSAHLKPGIHHMQVAHDDWCNLLRGKGQCNCNPDVRPCDENGKVIKQ